jgi:hypothetical protein
VKQQQCGDAGNSNKATLYPCLAGRDMEKLQKKRRRTINDIAIGASVVSSGLLSLFLLLMVRRLCAQRMEKLQGDGSGIMIFFLPEQRRAYASLNIL